MGIEDLEELLSSGVPVVPWVGLSDSRDSLSTSLSCRCGRGFVFFFCDCFESALAEGTSVLNFTPLQNACIAK